MVRIALVVVVEIIWARLLSHDKLAGLHTIFLGMCTIPRCTRFILHETYSRQPGLVCFCKLQGVICRGVGVRPTLLYCLTLCYSIMNSSCMHVFTYSTTPPFLLQITHWKSPNACCLHDPHNYQPDEPDHKCNKFTFLFFYRKTRFWGFLFFEHFLFSSFIF